MHGKRAVRAKPKLNEPIRKPETLVRVLVGSSRPTINCVIETPVIADCFVVLHFVFVSFVFVSTFLFTFLVG